MLCLTGNDQDPRLAMDQTAEGFAMDLLYLLENFEGRGLFISSGRELWMCDKDIQICLAFLMRHVHRDMHKHPHRCM